VTLTGAASPLPATTVVQGLDQNGTTLDAVDGTAFTVSGPLGSRALTIPAGATINDVMAQVNSFTAQTGARASYDPATGTMVVESTTFGAGTLGITSADMTSGASTVGLFDSDTTAGTNAFSIPATNQTMQLAYTDAGGTPRTLTLTQDPASAGGLTFTNLAGGPEAVAPFTAFAPGAFSVTLQDTSGGAVGSSMTVAAGSYTAVRQSTTFIQTGGLADQTTVLDLPDMRAAALGHSAGLAGSGFASLVELTSQSALTTGNTTSALAVIDAAIREVTVARGAAGAIQANALESTLDSLRVSFENLTSAESQLRDTDFAAESAAYARHNIVYQAATAMLAQANQVPQTILQMLR
jgi:flagellin